MKKDYEVPCPFPMSKHFTGGIQCMDFDMSNGLHLSTNNSSYMEEFLSNKQLNFFHFLKLKLRVTVVKKHFE